MLQVATIAQPQTIQANQGDNTDGASYSFGRE